VANRFDETDLSKVRPVSIEGRHSKVSLDDIVDPRGVFSEADAKAAQALLAAMPDMLVAQSLKSVVSALRRAREDGREIMWLIGAHTIKTGLSKYLGALIDEGYITCVSSTGSSVIHDLELAFFGKTSEDVAAELPEGRFGMSRETSEHFNAALAFAKDNDMGLGSGVGSYIESAGAPHSEASVFAAAHRKGIPATVHVAFGTDITHQHPGFRAGDAGELTMRDFRIFSDRVGKMFDQGMVIILGSAVVLPEVFLKAVSINYNLGGQPSGVTAASFDMLPQYRVRENVLSRPFQGASDAHAITGHHEIMVPLLYFLLRG
jgi:hypothetical protein